MVLDVYAGCFRKERKLFRMKNKVIILMFIEKGDSR